MRSGSSPRKSAATIGVVRSPLPARRPGLRRRGQPGDAGEDRGAPRHRDRTGRRGHRLRGVHLALSGELARAADPVALLRSSRPRCSGTTTTCPTTGTSPTPGSRRCANGRGGRDARSAASPATGSTSTSATSRRPALDEDEIYQQVRGNQRRRRGAASPWADADRIDRRRACAGASAATSAARAADLRRLARRAGARPRATGGWSTTRSGPWIVDQTDGDFDHLLIAHDACPGSSPPASTDSRRGTRRVCDGAHGAAASRAAEKLRRAVDFDHWGSLLEELPRASATCSAKSPPASAARNRPRSSSSAATSTTPTSARSAGPRARPTARRRSTRPSAPRTATRSRRKNSG